MTLNEHLSRRLSVPRQGAANKNLEFACSRWSIDTHSFAWAWGESRLSLEDVFILTRLSLCGGNIVDPAKLSLADREDVEALKALHKQAQNGPIFTAQGVRKAAPANAKKTSLGSWLRYFFKDLQPARTVAPGARGLRPGPQYQQRLYMAGFFSYFLSYYVLPNYPVDGISQAVFPLAVLLARGQPVALAPMFLGSLYRQLNLVQADYAWSLGRCDHLSMAHSTFLLAYFFEHFRTVALVPLVFPASGVRSRTEQWHGTSSEASWHEVCDVETNFTQRPYNIPSPGIMGVGQCLLPVASSLGAANGGDPVARTVINSALIALPGWLPTLCSETTGVAVYRPNRFARKLGFDQGVPRPAPAMPSFVESQLRFMAGQLSPILTQLDNLPIPARDRVSDYTPEFRVFWKRNFDSFLTFVRGQAVVPEASTIRTRDTSLRAITVVRATDWRGPRGQWAVIHAEPVNRVFPTEVPAPPQAAPGRTRARGSHARTQPPPPPPTGPSQPSSSQAPAAGETRRPKRIRN
ncbi:hypothetical protein C3L33_22816, partial [Rhododendron williamsianum]